MDLLNNIKEQEIINRIINGEKALFESVVRCYNPYLYKIGRSYNFNHHDTEDLMQDTFIDAFKGLKSFQGISTFKTWISTIMLNNCHKRSNKSSFKKEIMNDKINEKDEPLFQNQQGDTFKSIYNRDIKNIIENALQELPQNFRIVFALREINEMSISETALALNITEANVKTRLSRAKNQLQSIIQKSYKSNELYEYHAKYCNAMTQKILSLIHNL